MEGQFGSAREVGMNTVLTIAGFDPSSGAGVTGDLMVFAAHGMNGTSAITSLTVQSTRGVRAMHVVEGEILRATLDCLNEDLPADGIKIGMLGSAAVARVVCDHLERIGKERTTANRPVVVLDPVLRSSSGHELIDREGLDVLRSRLLGLVDWVTPNIPELELLSGTEVRDRQGMEDAAEALVQLGSQELGVLAKGGHMAKPDDLVRLASGKVEWLTGERVQTRATHGTGCALSSAFLCELVGGAGAVEAARRAKAYVRGAIETAIETGSGPCRMNYLWRTNKVKG